MRPRPWSCRRRAKNPRTSLAWLNARCRAVSFQKRSFFCALRHRATGREERAAACRGRSAERDVLKLAMLLPIAPGNIRCLFCVLGTQRVSAKNCQKTAARGRQTRRSCRRLFSYPIGATLEIVKQSPRGFFRCSVRSSTRLPSSLWSPRNRLLTARDDLETTTACCERRIHLPPGLSRLTDKTSPRGLLFR